MAPSSRVAKALALLGIVQFVMTLLHTSHLRQHVPGQGGPERNNSRNNRNLVDPLPPPPTPPIVNTTTLQSWNASYIDRRNPALHTILAGFGTASYALLAALETKMEITDDCTLAHPRLAEFKVLNHLQQATAIACDSLLYSSTSLNRLAKLVTSNATLTIVLPHPVWYLQEILIDHYLHEAWMPKQWTNEQALRRVKYEDYLLALGKTQISASELHQLAQDPQFDLLIHPLPWTVRILATNTAIHEFIRNKDPRHQTILHPPSYRPICKEFYGDIRSRAMVQAQHTATWLQKHFQVETDWSNDPCVS